MQAQSGSLLPPTPALNFGGPRAVRGALALAAAVAVYYFAAGNEVRMGTFWVLGLAFGFVLQRSRFCFASAFRDIFLLRHGRTLKGVLVGLAVAAVGFSTLMARQVPNTALGVLPPDANVLPMGLHTVVGGILFGFGMVIAGGCVSGSIYRMGEGYVASWVSFFGIILGVLGAAYTWNWWWEFQIEDGLRLWLPNLLGHGGALVLTLAALAGLFVLTLWWESRAGVVVPDAPFQAEEEANFAARLRNLFKRIFVHGWTPLLGGAVLGGLNVVSFITERPWGFTGELSRWSIGISNSLGFGPGILKGVDALPGCTLELGDNGVLHFMLFLVLGMIYGSFLAAYFAGEFKIRIPRQRIRFVQAGGGGLIMGYGAGIAMGCTIGAFFSAIASLAVNGWVFAIFLAVGAWLGTQAIQRIP
ncbi:MAG: YeeE/YedE family protein [Anaerolineae bacterium]|nr:YeeE/YedE family protein [Anaerolineae bacterium]NUQ03184.1 YeeE/YedE family protein [Anaerolineae bacterium]